jgi:hypothetical protein
LSIINLIVAGSDIKETKDPCKIYAQVSSAHIKLRPFTGETLTSCGGIVGAEAEKVSK